MLTVLVLLAAGAVHSPLDFEVSLGSSIEDDDADLDDLLTLEDAAFGDQWWRVSNVEGVPEPPSEENLGDDEILYGDI